jgi:hypothetical protein
MIGKIKSKIVELKSELAYQVALSNHAKNLPTLNGADSAILDTLKYEGVCVTSLAALGLETTPQLLNDSYNQLAAMPASQDNKSARKLPQIYTVTDLPAFSTKTSLAHYFGIKILKTVVLLRQLST